MKKQPPEVKKSSIFSSDLIFQNIIDALPVLLFWTNEKHVYLGNNIRHAIAFGYKSAWEVVGKTLHDTFMNVGFDESISERIYQDHEEIITTKTGQELEYNVSLFNMNRERINKTYLSQKYPLLDADNKIIGLIGVSMDISELKYTQTKLMKEKEKVEIASLSKSEFIASMSHDIRTPMTGILGMMQEISRITEELNNKLESLSVLTLDNFISHIRNFNRNIKEHADIALESANELLRLSNEILELSRLESGKADVAIEVFSLSEIIKHNQELLKSVAVHKRLDFKVKMHDFLPDYLYGARQYLDRILLNVISNALKFTEFGQVFVDVTLVNPPAEGIPKFGEKIALQITIEDTGIGIPQEDFERIFEHFSRLTSAYQGVYKGSGLGLYTVKHYVNAMEGQIDLESTVGKGTRFKVTLPFIVDDIANSTTRSQPQTVFTSRLKQKNESGIFKPAIAEVLIVEDHPIAAMAIQMMLEHLSCHVDIANNGKQALEKVTQRSYDIIFMDIGLPDISGLDVTQMIRAMPDPKISQLPIIALTGHIDENEHHACIKVGMNDALTKPPQSLVLESLLEHWVWLPHEK